MLYVNKNQRKAKVVILVSLKIDFRANNTIKETRGLFMMKKRT
jgi:hypothetical protein